MIAEILICLIHSPPYLNNVTVPISTTGSTPKTINVDIDLIVTIMVPLRVYLLFRYFASYSSWADDRAEKICHQCNATGGVAFAIKAELKERPYTTVGLLMTLSIIIFGYGLRNVELAFMQDKTLDKFQDWRYIWNGFWCIIITILTVGYGDYYPQTHLGRVICVFACLWGNFLISLMVVSLNISVEFTPQEEKAYDEIKKDLLYINLKHKGMMLIRNAYRLNQKLDSLEGDEDAYSMTMKQNAIKKFNKSIVSFRQVRKFVINQENENSTENILNKLNAVVSDSMEDLINLSNHHVVNLIEHVKLSKTFQEEINNNIEKLEKMTKGIYVCLNDTDKEKDFSEKRSEVQSIYQSEKTSERNEDD
jgi:hypothetical protein